MIGIEQYNSLLSDIKSYDRPRSPTLAIEWEIASVYNGDWNWSWCTLQC